MSTQGNRKYDWIEYEDGTILGNKNQCNSKFQISFIQKSLLYLPKRTLFIILPDLSLYRYLYLYLFVSVY